MAVLGLHFCARAFSSCSLKHFIMVVFKSLSDNSNISVVSVLASINFFFIQCVILLVLEMVNDFFIEIWIFLYYIELLHLI